MSFESASQIISLVASFAALISTFYFWLVRVNREQPDLGMEKLGPWKGCVLLPQEHTEAYRSLKPTEDEVMAGYWVDLAVINNSIVPNAVLEINAEIRLHDGPWQTAEARLTSEGKLPINLSPLTTVGLPVELTTCFKGSYSETTNQQRADMATDALTAGDSVRIRIKGIRGVTFEFTLSGKEVKVDAGTAANSKPAKRQAA